MNLKALIEKRNALIADMKSLCDKATAETRAMTTEEQTDYDTEQDNPLNRGAERS